MAIAGIINFSKYFTLNAQELSHRVKIPIVFTIEPNKLYIVFSAQDAVDLLLEAQKRDGIHYIIMQSENIESGFFKNPNYIILLRQNRVFQYSQYTAQKCLEQHEILTSAFFKWEYPQVRVTGVRTIDLLFFGFLTKKRHDIMHSIQNKFPKKTIVVTCDAFGEDLDALLRKTKNVINISAYSESVLETHRINQCLAYGCHVISNRSLDKALDNAYEQRITFCGNTLPDYLSAVSKII